MRFANIFTMVYLFSLVGTLTGATSSVQLSLVVDSDETTGRWRGKARDMDRWVEDARLIAILQSFSKFSSID